MTTDQEKTITRISGNGQLDETSPRMDSHRVAPRQSTSHGKLLVAAWLAVVILIGWAVYHRSRSSSDSAAAGVQGRTPPVPVVEGVVATKNVPIFLDGLGTVQAFNTVTVHTRVDGQLMKVAFSEGQDVTAGDVLAQLDPAPY